MPSSKPASQIEWLFVQNQMRGQAMDHDFWHQRWQQNQIGFHKHEFNPILQTHWPRLSIPEKARVFVPLCGKSKDLLWLLAMGYQVVGVELSPLAVESFFADNNLQPTVRRQGDFWVSEVDGLQIFCGDFFALQTADVGEFDAVYDRAALVALPPDMRIDYVMKLSSLLPTNVQMLLIAFDYPQHEMPGPPFSVQADEVERLYSHWCEVELLTSDDALATELHFKERGLTKMVEQTYKLLVR
ncbi:thiopurine S-methyltransferase [Methylomonas sp. MO1]|uniref:thiopurine S-methyltransferase n=2 Tax=unclassified Methylomonas TaxID=2608980 RepID=UPI000374C6C6|nr:thiopurine S-methyltransferase [Methylomonas sp. MO1]MDT4292002.1 thiopurine S-methyltransferase [Methylomonas sp. MO1]